MTALRASRPYNLTGDIRRSGRCETQPVTSQAEAKMACFSYIQSLTDVQALTSLVTIRVNPL